MPELLNSLGDVLGLQLHRVNLCRGRWKMPLLFSYWQCSWQVPICSRQYLSCKWILYTPLELRTTSHFVVQWLTHVHLFVTTWTAARQASLSFTISRSLLKLMSTESVMPSNHLTRCCLLLLLPSIFPRVFSSELSESFLMSLHQVAKVLELQLQHQSFQWILIWPSKYKPICYPHDQ